MLMIMDVSRIFLDYSARKLRQLGDRIQDCLSRLSEDQLWSRGGQNENAAGNLVLHLCGNVRQWILSAIGGQTDLRQRDGEFAAHGLPAASLSAQLRDTVDQAIAIIDALPPDRLAEHIHPQNYDVSVLEAIYHVIEHFSGHTGQIIFITKLLTGQDLGYYRHLAKPGTHSQPMP
jgi:uncharacterized damage-inducible protein DinB